MGLVFVRSLVFFSVCTIFGTEAGKLSSYAAVLLTASHNYLQKRVIIDGNH